MNQYHHSGIKNHFDLGGKLAQIFCNTHTHAIIVTLRSQPALNKIYLQFGLSNLALYLPAGREASGSPGPFLDKVESDSLHFVGKFPQFFCNITFVVSKI